MSAIEVSEAADQDLRHVDDWRDAAVCSGNTQLFFAKKAERPQARARREAKANQLCSVCPVRTACQAFARSNHEFGFWGGESEEDRHLAGFTVTAPIGIRARNADREMAVSRATSTDASERARVERDEHNSRVFSDSGKVS